MWVLIPPPALFLWALARSPLVPSPTGTMFSVTIN